MKGIILAGGSGTRLYPFTEGLSKQLILVYDKPMIYYPLSVLMQAKIRDILIITTKKDQVNFKRILGNGSKFGVNLEYIVQPSPDGIAEALILAEEFIGDDNCAMVLGDNIFYSDKLENILSEAITNTKEGYTTIFGYKVNNPQRFGIMELDKDNKILSVEEKPENPKSNIAITGLYFYPKGVSKKAKLVKPSPRGELEITTLNDLYLQEDTLKPCILDDNILWFDVGTFDSLLEASTTIRDIQKDNDKIISCLEEIAYKQGWLDKKSIEQRAEQIGKNNYGKYLRKVIEKENLR